MITFIVIGAIGLVLLLVALPLGDVFDFGDGVLSGTSLGAGAVAFGAIGAIVTANGLPTVLAYVASAVFWLLTVWAVQKGVERLTATEDGKPFMGDNFKTTLKDLEARMREAAANLEFETAGRLRDEIKRLKMLDLEFANEMLTPAGETADRGAVKRVKAEARAEAAERFRKGRL